MLGFVLVYRRPKNLDGPNAKNQWRHRGLVTREQDMNGRDSAPMWGGGRCAKGNG